MAPTIRRALVRNSVDSSIDGRGRVTLPSARYAPGGHMKYPPKECTFMANRMFGWAWASATTLPLSASDSSAVPAYVPERQLALAPTYPSK
ncbi:hypothetical protein GCM10027614_32690 [Micromonospora vulcania]